MSRMTSAFLATGLLLGLAGLTACGTTARGGFATAGESGRQDLQPGDVERLTGSLAALQQRLDRLEARQAGEATGGRVLPPTLAGRVVDVAGLPALGSDAARVAIIEVTDYQCPFCRTHFRETLPLVLREFVDSGEARYIVLDYPLPGHAEAGLAAIAARCAAEQGRYWPYHDRLFDSELTPGTGALLALGESLGLDSRPLQDCLARLQADPFIEQQRSLASGLGVRGTPTFFIGRLTPDRVVTDLTMLAGLQSLDGFREVIRRYLGS